MMFAALTTRVLPAIAVRVPADCGRWSSIQTTHSMY